MNGFLKHPNLSHLLRLNPQKGSFWHEIWVFLNLIEVLIDRLKITEVFHITPYYDFSKSSFIEGESVFIRWHRPQPYGKNLQEKCEQYFPTYSMRTKDNKELHIWYQYWLTPVNKKGGVIDLAVALGKYEIKARERKAPTSHLDEVKMYVDNKYLWRLYKDNELFIYQPYDPPDILIECKDKSSGNRKSENQLKLYAEIRAKKHILISNNWEENILIPQKFVIIEEIGKYLSVKGLQNSLFKELKEILHSFLQ